MKHFSLRLRKILLFDYIYYLILVINIIYLIIYNSNYECKSNYEIEQEVFKLRINNYKIDGDKLSFEFDNLIGVYYFNSLKEKKSFISDYSLNDLLLINGKLEEADNNTIPNTFNYKKYLLHKKIFDSR